MVAFVDSNLFIRLFAGDDPAQSESARRLFESAENGAVGLVTGPPVLFEVAWVLRYRYKIKSPEILDVIEAIVSFPGLDIYDRGLVVDAVFLARGKSVDFADAYIAVLAEQMKADSIATFNKKHFEKLGAKIYRNDIYK